MLILGERYRSRLEGGLRKHTDEQILWLPDNPSLDPRLAGHADLSVFVYQTYLFSAEEEMPVLVKRITNTGYQPIPVAGLGKIYPDDVKLCACWTGKHTFINTGTISETILPYLTESLIEVTQGYTKCSICVIKENAIITSDKMICRKAIQNGLDALLIKPGCIELEGYDYGFIGGASFMIDHYTLAFTGKLHGHPDKDRIIEFITQQGLRCVYLTDEPIFDIGGAVRLP